MTNFLHGITITEVESGARMVTTASTSVIGIVGTAPEAQAEIFPLNTPVLIPASYTEAGKLGTSGTLPGAVNAILDQIGAVIVVVRVEEALGETAEADTIANILGESTAYTGVNALLTAKNKLGVTPRILLAPGFSTKEVITQLNVIADKMRAIVIGDVPESDNLIQFSTDCSSDRVYLVYPEVTNAKGTAPASPYVAGVIARSDNENGWWVSPSNKLIRGITGISKNIDFTFGDTGCKANYLNENGIATIINQNGYRLWGNRSTIKEGAYKFLCVRRTADIIYESILQSHLWAVDRNIVKNYLVDVVESVNAFLSTLKAQGAIIDGKCWANKELNTEISEGKVCFDFEFTPAYPAEHVTFRAYLNNENIEEILMENLA